MICKYCEKKFKNESGLNSHMRNCKKTITLKPIVIDLYINDYLNIKEISIKLKINKTKVIEYLGENKRNQSEANILAHKKYPDSFKHSEESKKIMREKRLKWMKNNPDKTAWRLSNLSYPEKLMLDKFIELEYDKKYLIIREKSFFPYFIDFAFENEKLAIEVDGSQHLLPERMESDKLKNSLLLNNGWSVIRISENEVKNNIENVITIITDKLNKCKKIEKINVGIVKERKKYIKKERNENGFTDKQINSMLNQRKAKRPSLLELEKEIKILGLEGTGRKYGVTGNSIKKWVKTYKKIGL